MELFLYYLIIFIFGLAIGSFMNSWVWRTRENLGISHARSICSNCRIQIEWYDNVPVLSYIILKGHCRKCHLKISKQYPLVEIACGLLFLLTAFLHNRNSFIPSLSSEIIRDWLILFFLLFIFLYDLKYREILSITTMIPSIFLFFFSLVFSWHSWSSMLLGAAFGAGFFLFLYIISKGKWIGGGDVRLGFFMGVILGWPHILVAFFVSYLIGAVFNLFLIVIKKKTLKDETAFGTYLVFGTFVAMFWGQSILDWYLGFVM